VEGSLIDLELSTQNVIVLGVAGGNGILPLAEFQINCPADESC